MEKDFFEKFKEFIRETVRTCISESQNITMFEELPDISSTDELANNLRCSGDVVLRMAQAGMPHTHIGREYRFHKSLLVEWTYSGQRPFPCEICAKNKTEKIETDDEKNPFSEKSNVAKLRSIGHKTSGKLASMVGG